MSTYRFTLAGRPVHALPQGALWLAQERILAVADLHLGKAERIARREGRLTPPYETTETLTKLADLIDATGPRMVVCVGDSFDDLAAADSLADQSRLDLARLMAGRRWFWIAGNHDPAPAGMGGESAAELAIGNLVFRHIAARGPVEGEVSGHFHPKARLRGRGRPAFLIDAHRAILPAFGAYTGGLDATDAAFDPLLAEDALVLITGLKIIPAPRTGLIGHAQRPAKRLAPKIASRPRFTA